jgi:transposase
MCSPTSITPEPPAAPARPSTAETNTSLGGLWRLTTETILASFPSCPIPEIARLGRTLKQWADAFLGYFRTGGANNGGTEAVNGLIELHRRIARGFRNRENYRLRMLLIAGGLDQPPPQV